MIADVHQKEYELSVIKDILNRALVRLALNLGKKGNLHSTII